MAKIGRCQKSTISNMIFFLKEQLLNSLNKEINLINYKISLKSDNSKITIYANKNRSQFEANKQ